MTSKPKVGRTYKRRGVRGTVQCVDGKWAKVVCPPQDVHWNDSLKFQWWLVEEMEQSDG